MCAKFHEDGSVIEVCKRNTIKQTDKVSAYCMCVNTIYPNLPCLTDKIIHFYFFIIKASLKPIAIYFTKAVMCVFDGAKRWRLGSEIENIQSRPTVNTLISKRMNRCIRTHM